jgi:ATP-binding cassette subfamily B multidrug efflux pump
VIIYFISMVVVAASFNVWLLLPFVIWLVLYGIALRVFVPRLGKVSQAQADARSLMTGRITDAYTNIATVKLFSHSRREADYARGAMREFLVTASSNALSAPSCSAQDKPHGASIVKPNIRMTIDSTRTTG